METNLRLLAWATASTAIAGVVAWASGATLPEQVQVAQSVEMESAAPAVPLSGTVPFICSSACDIGAVFARHGLR